MVDPDIIEEWISKADEDFEFARINLEEEKPFHAQICFHFQQAAEKYLMVAFSRWAMSKSRAID